MTACGNRDAGDMDKTAAGTTGQMQSEETETAVSEEEALEDRMLTVAVFEDTGTLNPYTGESPAYALDWVYEGLTAMENGVPVPELARELGDIRRWAHLHLSSAAGRKIFRREPVYSGKCQKKYGSGPGTQGILSISAVPGGDQLCGGRRRDDAYGTFNGSGPVPFKRPGRKLSLRDDGRRRLCG